MAAHGETVAIVVVVVLDTEHTVLPPAIAEQQQRFRGLCWTPRNARDGCFRRVYKPPQTLPTGCCRVVKHEACVSGQNKVVEPCPTPFAWRLGAFLVGLSVLAGTAHHKAIAHTTHRDLRIACATGNYFRVCQRPVRGVVAALQVVAHAAARMVHRGAAYPHGVHSNG